MKAYSMDLREKIIESVKKGVSKSETARRFGIHRARVKRFCKQLDERGTLQPRKAPGKAPKLDEKATRRRPRREAVGHPLSERAEFLFAILGVRVSEATVCRAVGRLHRSRKKIQNSGRTRRVLEGPMAHGCRPRQSRALGVGG